MTKFKYYIITLLDGEVKGTNSDELAKSYREDEDSWVIEPDTNKWYLSNTETEIQELK